MKEENHDQIQLFDHYISQKMSDQDRLTFEKRLQEDAGLRGDFAAFMKSKELIYKAGYQEEKAFFETKRAQELQKRKRVVQLRTRMMIAAAITILVALAFIFLPSSPPSHQELITTYYSVPEAPTILSPDQDSLLRVADLLYTNKNYQAAQAAYTSLAKHGFSPADQSRISLFQGICALETNQFSEATQFFAAADQHRQEADWYSALSWLKAEDGLEQAKSALKQISETERHFYGAKAKELLRELE